MLINNKENSAYGKFYNKYREEILGKKSIVKPVAFNYDFSKLLKENFYSEKHCFTSTVSIPSAEDIISIFDFLYDVDFNKMQPGSLEKAKIDIKKTYRDGPINFTFEYNMYVCQKP